MKWEYRTLVKKCESIPNVNVYGVDVMHEESLNRLGADEWELIAVVPMVSDDLISAVTYIFKRPQEAALR